MWLISKRREMFNADESHSKIAAVWEGTSDVRTLWSCNCCGCSGFILFTACKLHNLKHIQGDAEFLNKSLDLLQLIGRKGRRTTTNFPVCVHLVWEKVSVDQRQGRDQNLGITCLEINNWTVKQWQCLWTGNLVSKQDFVTKRFGDSHQSFCRSRSERT